MYGLAGDDELVGFDGDDVLEGGAGADVLWGGYGFDYASYKGSPAGVTVYLSSSYGAERGDAQGDVLHEIEGVIGSAYDDLLGGDDQGQRPARRGRRRRARRLWGDDALYGEGGERSDQTAAPATTGWTAATATTGWRRQRRRRARGRRRRRHRQLRERRSAGVVADLASGTAQGGGHGSDRLSGIENLEGTHLRRPARRRRAGPTRWTGASGADVLDGRGGADRFVYHYTGESTAAAPDLHPRLQPQAGRPDRPFRRRPERAGGRRPGVPVHRPGPVHGRGPGALLPAGGDTVVEANTDDAAPGAELRIVLDPLVNLQATDFVL